MMLLNLPRHLADGRVDEHAHLESHRIVGNLHCAMLDCQIYFRSHQIRVIIYGNLIHWWVVDLLLLLGLLLLLFGRHEPEHPSVAFKPNVIINRIMFYFQYVIESIKMDYAEFSPEIFIRFGEITNKLELPDLEVGVNSLGLGKELSLNITREEIETWFKEYAFCIELKGGVLNGRSLIGICSLEKLDYSDQVDGITISLKDLRSRKTTAELIFSLKFKHIHHKAVTEVIPQTTYIEKKKETEANQKRMAETMRSTQSKPNSFLYGNSTNSKITQKPKNKTKQIKKGGKSLNKTTEVPKNKTVKDLTSFKNQNIPQNYLPYQLYQNKQIVVEIPTSELFNQQYFCPPPMEFTNNPIQQIKYEPVYVPKPPSPKQIIKQQMDNYSFQGKMVPENKKIQKSKVKQAIQKKRIKQLVEQQFANKQGYVVVPIKTATGEIVFKKLDEVKQTDLENLVTKKQQAQKPQILKPIPKISKTHSEIIKADPSPVNDSVEYPEDFESMSMSLGNQSLLNRQFGTMSKIRKTEQIVQEESISEIQYSDNFESYSASRSNIKKSYDDISESLRSFSQSFKR